MSEKLYGKIIVGVGGKYNVLIEDTGEIIKKCPARGAFRRASMTPLPGDDVTLEKSGGSYFISEIEKRKNVFIRPAMANLSNMFITVSATHPAPDTVYVDKLTAISVHNNVAPVIVITKSELDGEYARELHTLYSSCGFTSFLVSSYEKLGIDELKKYFDSLPKGSISAFAGASGAGKSTLINALFPSLCCKVGELSEKIERGKNTTRHVELFTVADKIYLADTPGFSMLDLERFDFFTKDDLPYLFPEYKDYLFGCKYKKCSHTSEDGCAIIRDVNENKLSKSRHDSYVAIYNDLKKRNEWEHKGNAEHIKI